MLPRVAPLVKLLEQPLGAHPPQAIHFALQSLLLGELFNDSLQLATRLGEAPRLRVPTHRLQTRLPIVLRNRLRDHLGDHIVRQRRGRHARFPRHRPLRAMQRRELRIPRRQLGDSLHHRNRPIGRLHLVDPSTKLVERRDVDRRPHRHEPRRPFGRMLPRLDREQLLGRLLNDVRHALRADEDPP